MSIKLLSRNNLDHNKINAYNDFIENFNKKYNKQGSLDAIDKLHILEYTTCFAFNLKLKIDKDILSQIKEVCKEKLIKEIPNFNKFINDETDLDQIINLISDKVYDGYNKVNGEICRKKLLCRSNSFIDRHTQSIEPYLGDDGLINGKYYYGLYGSDKTKSDYIKFKTLNFKKDKINVKFQTYITFLITKY